MQLFPNVLQDGNENAEDAATIYSVKQDECFQEEKFDLGCSYSDSLDEAPAQRSWLRAITIYRDFMFSAFTDSYSTASCCSEGFFPGGLGLPSRNKVAPLDAASATSVRSTSARSITHSPSGESPSMSPSYESRRRRRKPLAVAVGFKYAEDMNGRPVVVTRTCPSDLSGSPPSTPSRAKEPLREWNNYDSPSPPILINEYKEEKLSPLNPSTLHLFALVPGGN